MIRLRIREICDAKQIKLVELARLTSLHDMVIRRLYYNTATGYTTGKQIEFVSLKALEKIATVLEVPFCDLFETVQDKPDNP